MSGQIQSGKAFVELSGGGRKQTGFEVVNRICEQLGLPMEVYALTLTADVSGAADLEVRLRVRTDTVEMIVEQIDRYELVKKDDAANLQ